MISNFNELGLMHLGPNSEECPKLMVHNLPMKMTTKEKYLGDIVSNSGNNQNIENRIKIGFKAIPDILPILKEVGFTSFYIKCRLIFRDAVLKCKLLLNSEVWHGLNANQVNKLEDIYKTFLRIILNSHAKVGTECLFFKVWKMPLKYEIILRRLMYLWKILHVDKSELIFRVYQSQLNTPWGLGKISCKG